MKLTFGLVLIAVCITLSARSSTAIDLSDLNICDLLASTDLSGINLGDLGDIFGSGGLGNIGTCEPTPAMQNCDLPPGHETCFAAIYPAMDKAAGLAADAVSQTAGGIVDVSGCSESAQALICYFTSALFSCDQQPLCRSTCEEFRTTCVIEVDTDKVEQELSDLCSSIPLTCDTGSIPNLFSLSANFCDGLPTDNCSDAGVTEQLEAAKAAVNGGNTALIAALAVIGVLAVIGGAVLYRKLSPSRNEAAAALASDMSSGKYSQASGKTRSVNGGASSGGGRSSGGRSSGGGRSNSRSSGARSGRSSTSKA